MSPAAANMLIASDPIDSAKSRRPRRWSRETLSLKSSRSFFATIIKAIFRVAYRITGSQSDAEDVLQTIFLRLTPSGTRRDLSPNPQAYLYRAAVNASLDLLRHRKRANAVSLDVVDFDQSSKHSVASPEDDLADMELRELIRQAVAKLEGRAATAFALRYFEGYDNGQHRRSFRHVAIGRRGHAAPRQDTPAQRDRQLFGETS